MLNKVRKQKDILMLIFNSFVIYNYLFNTNFNIKSNTQYQCEPILWKLNSILNDSILSVHVLLVIITYMVYVYNNKIIVLTLPLVMYYTLHVYTSQFIFSNIIKITTYNITLFNGLLLIHPIYLYISYACILYILIFFKKKQLNAYTYVSTIVFKKNFFFVSSVFALILGCWWAQQEISWGGWWNWDPIEMIALMVFILSCTIVHLKFNRHRWLFYTNVFIVVFIVNTYFISRYDILNSIHSFALSSKSQQYVEIKIIALYSVYLNSFFYFYKNKKTQAINYSAIVVVLIFFVYFLYNMITFFKNITLNAVFSSNVNSQNEKYSYEFIWVISFITLLYFGLNKRIFFLMFLFCIIAYTDYFVIITVVVSMLVFKFFLKISVQPRISVQNIHYLVLFIAIALLFYSNLEIFFSTKYARADLQKCLSSINMQTTTILYDVMSTCNVQNRSKAEVFLQNSHILVKLLSQNIQATFGFNINKIQLSKSVWFVQSYLYLYVIVWSVICVLIYSKKFKSGIV